MECQAKASARVFARDFAVAQNPAQLSEFYRSVSERRKSPRVCAKINKQTCVRKSACNIQPPTHRQSTCSAAGGAGGLGMQQQLENAEQVIYAATDIPPGTRIKKFFRGKNEHPETPCLRINSDFSKKIIKKTGAAWPHMALKVGSSINLQRGRRARTPSSASSVAIISWLSLVFFCQAVNLHHF